MAEYQITRWREIPSMVTARDAGGTAKVSLPNRFQEAIDEVAMQAGAAATDAYLAGWVQDAWQTREGSAAEVADAVLFLLSPLARGITADVLYVDGGFHAV